MYEQSIFKRIVATFVAFVHLFFLIPCQEFYIEKEQGLKQLNHYLNLAQEEKEQARWIKLADQGVIAAMATWESATLQEKEEDFQSWQMQKKEVQSFYEQEKNLRYAKWLVNGFSQATQTSKQHELYMIMENLGNQWDYIDKNGNVLKEIDSQDVQLVLDQWNNSVFESQDVKNWWNSFYMEKEDLLALLDSVEIDSTEKENLAAWGMTLVQDYLQNEYQMILQAEGNDILTEMLYDKNSLKHLSNEDAAQVIATKLAQEAKEESTLVTQELFSMLNNDISSVKANEIVLGQENWTEEFNLKLKEGLAKWEEAEKEFLLARNQWEIQSEQAFLESEENWQKAYNNLRLARKKWEDETLKAISEGLKKWDSATEELRQQIYDAEIHFSKLIMDERSYKEKILNSQITLYNQSRQMMALCVQGIQGWFQLWAEKYNKVYHYWKTEDNTFFNLDSYIEGFTKDQGESFNEKYIVDLDYFISQVGSNELKTQIALWQSGYLKMLAKQMENTHLKNYNNNLQQLNKEIEGIESEKSRIQAAIYNSSSSNLNDETTEQALLYTNSEKKELDPQKELELLNQKYATVLEKIQQVNAEISTLEKTILSLNQISNKVSSTQFSKNQIQSVLGEKYLNYFDEELWESPNVLFDLEEGWISLAKEYKTESEKSIEKQYELFGAVISDDNMDNLYLEKIKNQAKIKYWETEVKIAQALNDYALDISSGVEKAEDSILALQTAEKEYNLRVQEYESILDSMELIRGDIQIATQDLENKGNALSEKQKEVEKARDLYQKSLLALEGLDIEYLKTESLIILDEISFLEKEENIENATMQFIEYINNFATYDNALIKDTINQIKLDVANGFGTNLSIDELYNLSVEGKNLLEKAKSTETTENFLLEVETYLSKASKHYESQCESIKANLLLLTEQTGTENINFLQDFSKLLTEIDYELLKRNQIIDYINGKAIEQIWTDPNSVEATNIQQTYNNFRQENLVAKDLEAKEKLLDFFEQLDEIKNLNFESVTEKLNEVLENTEGLHNTSAMVRDEIFCNILTWCGIKDYYENNVQQITEEELNLLKTEIETGFEKYNICLTWEQNITNLENWLYMLQTPEHRIFCDEEMDLFEQYCATLISKKIDCSEIATIDDFLYCINEETWKANFIALDKELQERIFKTIIEFNNSSDNQKIELEAIIEIINLNEKLIQKENLAKNWEFIYLQGIYSEQNSTLEKSISILQKQGINVEKTCMDYKLNSVWSKIIQQKNALEKLYEKDSFYNIGLDSQDNYFELEEKINTAQRKYYEAVDFVQLEKDLDQFAKEIENLTGSTEKLEEACKQANSSLVNANEELLVAKTDYEKALDSYFAIMEEYEELSIQADEGFEKTEKASTELRIAQKKYEWGTSIYLKAKGGTIESPKEKLDQANYSLEIAKLTQQALESVVTQKNIENQEYEKAQLEYIQAKRQQYLSVVLVEEAARAIYEQKNAIRMLEAEETVVRNSIVQTVDSFVPEDNKWTELISVEKDQKGNYIINLAYDINTATETAFKKTTEQNSELLTEYVTNKNCIRQLLDSTEEYTLCEKEGLEWWINISSTSESYANDLMLSSLYLKSMLDESFLDGFVNPKDKNAFVADTIPTHSLFHGLDIGEMYLECRMEELKKAWEKVSKTEQGKNDVAKLILYGNTILLEDIATKTKNELEKRSLKVLEKELKDKETQAYKNATVFYSLAASYTAFGFINWAGYAMGAAMLVNAVTETDKGNSIKAVRNATEDLRKGKTTLLKNQESNNQQKITSWLKLQEELKNNNEKLFIMEGSNKKNEDNSLENTLMNYEKFLLAINTIVKESKTITLEEVKIICSEEIYNKAHAEKASNGTEESTMLLQSVLEKKLNAATEKLENEVLALNQKTQQAKTEYYEKLERFSELDRETKTLLRKLWERSGDNQLTENERKAAEKEYEKELVNATNEIKAELSTLKELAQMAFGKWNEKQHQGFLTEQELNLLGKNININKETESYTINQESKVFQGIMSLIDISYNEEIKLAQEEWKREIERQEKEKTEWITQAMNIVELGRKEWEKAEEKINAGYNTWRNNFIKEYEKGKEGFEESYSEYLEAKNNWIQKEYLYATGYGSATDIERSGKEAEEALQEVLRKVNIQETKVWKEEATEYIEEVANLGKEYASMINGLSKNINGEKIKSHTRKISKEVSMIHEEVKAEVKASTEKMEKLAGKVASEYAEQIIQMTRKSYKERLDAENDAMEKWQEKLALEAGYQVSETEIKREVVVDATIRGGVYEEQKIKKYERYETSIPEMNKTLGILVRTGSEATRQIEAAQNELKKWADRIFGETKEDGTTKEWIIPREVAKKGQIKEYESADRSKESEEKLEELLEKGKVISLRDGELGRHIGYSPIFKEKPEIKGKKNEIIKKSGLGEIEKIMLDYQWNSLRAGNGLTELSKPSYDKKMWVSNSFIEPPTLRGVMDIAANIAGNILGGPGMGAVLGYVDDLLFAGLDLTGGYKTIEQVGLELGKKVASQAIGAGIGKASTAISDIVSTTLVESSKFANITSQVGISASTSYATSIANNAVNSFYIGEDGLAFNTDGFTKSLYSTDTISGALGAGITAGLNASTIGYNNQYVNGFNNPQIGNIKTFNTLMGGLATNTSSLLMGGNATFNLASAYGVGLLEFSFGKDGISSRLGMGGTNVSFQNLRNVAAGATNLHKNRQINKTGYDKTTLDALRSQWGFGDDAAKDQLDDIIKGDTVLKFDAEGSEVAQSVTENGQKIIHINSSQNQGFIDLGLTLQHEAHRDGVIGDEESQQIETTNAVLGHTVMAKKMQNDSLYKFMMNDIIDTNQNLQNDLAVFDHSVETGDWGAFGDYVNAAYDSSADYWKLFQREDGKYGWIWDGDYNFNIDTISSLTPEEMKKYIEKMNKVNSGEIIMHSGKVTEVDLFMNTLAKLVEDTDEDFYEFLQKTEGFADASIAAKMLESGNLSQENINAMNAGLYAAQESGLLVKNEIGQVYDTSLPFVLNDPNDKTWITTQYGFDLFNGSIRNHSELDIVVNTPKDGKYSSGITKLLVPEKSDMILSYGSDIGLKATFAFGDKESILYGHMDSSSVYSYFAAFGTTGTSIDSNGILRNVPKGIQAGYIGNTGAKSTGSHLHVGYQGLIWDEKKKINSVGNINPKKYFSQLEYINVTPYATVTSGLQNINSTEDTLKLTHIMDYYNYVNGNTNWNKDSFGDFYFTYANIMDDSAFTVATIMYLYGRGR